MDYNSVMYEEDQTSQLRQRLLQLEKEIQDIKSKLPPPQEELISENKYSEPDCGDCLECCSVCSLCCLLQSQVVRR